MTNRYPGKCDRCGSMVAATTGTIHRVNGRWSARHVTCTPAQAYDYGMNEGGDGYNPYAQESDMAELVAAQRRQGCPRCRQTPQRRSQLWEECDHCGHEPVYV